MKVPESVPETVATPEQLDPVTARPRIVGALVWLTHHAQQESARVTAAAAWARIVGLVKGGVELPAADEWAKLSPEEQRAKLDAHERAIAAARKKLDGA